MFAVCQTGSVSDQQKGKVSFFEERADSLPLAQLTLEILPPTWVYCITVSYTLHILILAPET